LCTAEINVSDIALSASPDPDRALPTVLGHKKWNDDVLICERLLRADSAPFELPCLAPLPPPSAVPPADDDTGPIGYSRYTQDPSHRGEAMRHVLKPEWITAENLEMEGLVRRKVWERVLRSSLQSYDKVFATRFHYKIKRKGGKFDKLKVRLVIQGQHMRLKDDAGKGDYTDAVNPVPHASVLRILLAIATVTICSLITSISLKPLPKVTYNRAMAIWAIYTSLLRRVFLRIRHIVIASSSLFMVCPVQPVLGSKP
jgi:hypothetical protein